MGYNDLWQYAVCPPLAQAIDIHSLASSYPREECIAGTCDDCGGEYQVLPKCVDLRNSADAITTRFYRYVDKHTKGGKVFKAMDLVRENQPVKDLWQIMNADLPSALQHHYGSTWISAMTAHLQANIPAGTLFIRIDFPERQVLLQRARFNEQEYKKDKLLFLVLALTQRLVGGDVKHHCCCYVGAGSLSKDLDLILEAIKDAVTWAKGKGGVSKVIYISDRCRAEFSNHNLLFFLSMHEKLLAIPATWCFDMPGHGKGTCDGLGAGIKKMLGNWMCGLEDVPSPSECVQHLCRCDKRQTFAWEVCNFSRIPVFGGQGQKPISTYAGHFYRCRLHKILCMAINKQEREGATAPIPLLV